MHALLSSAAAKATVCPPPHLGGCIVSSACRGRRAGSRHDRSSALYGSNNLRAGGSSQGAVHPCAQISATRMAAAKHAQIAPHACPTSVVLAAAPSSGVVSLPLAEGEGAIFPHSSILSVLIRPRIHDEPGCALFCPGRRSFTSCDYVKGADRAQTSPVISCQAK